MKKKKVEKKLSFYEAVSGKRTGNLRTHTPKIYIKPRLREKESERERIRERKKKGLQGDGKKEENFYIYFHLKWKKNTNDTLRFPLNLLKFVL